LRRTLPTGATLTSQGRREHLARHQGASWFALVPDLLVSTGDRTIVIDTKWKRVDKALANGTDKYGLSQADFYQMYAYGQRYLDGEGDVALVYPKTSTFDAALDVFAFSEELRLWVIPFDLNTGVLCAPKHIAAELQAVTVRSRRV
jgi:5-methylcytosine-specific restriction enzyme subunit McrC